MLLGSVPDIAEQFICRQEYALYLVQTASEFWVNDSSQRVQPAYAERKVFEKACVWRLEQHSFSYVCLRGTWEEREAQAIDAV